MGEHHQVRRGAIGVTAAADVTGCNLHKGIANLTKRQGGKLLMKFIRIRLRILLEAQAGQMIMKPCFTHQKMSKHFVQRMCTNTR